MSGERLSSSPTAQDIAITLDSAEKLFWSDLALMARRGRVSHVRDAAVSLGLIKAFQTSLGQSLSEGPTLTARLLGASIRWVQSVATLTSFHSEQIRLLQLL